MSISSMSNIIYPIIGLVLVVVVILIISTAGIIDNVGINDALNDSSKEIVSIVGVISLIVIAAVVTKKK